MLFPAGFMWVVMLLAALLSAVQAALAREIAAPARAVLSVPVIAQTYNLSCEAASLEMALAYEGVKAGQAALLAQMRPDGSTPTMSGGRVVRWSDPYANFVGDPAGHEYNATGYGVYYPVVAEVAVAEGRRALWSGTGLAWSQLAGYVRAGHPVVAWVAYDGAAYEASTPLYYYLAWDGRRIPFGPGYEHAVTVAGISDDAVLINNPRWGFQQWLPRATFLSAFAVFGDMAVVVG